MLDPAFLPVDVGVMHFVGIGGIGMSGMAEIMHKMGYIVQGSDQKRSATTDRLETKGIKVFIGHAEEQVQHARFVIYSTAVPRDNPELAYAIAHKKSVVKRAEMLAELMRHSWSVAIAGSHGKTTTTSLTAAILKEASYDPTVINGGIINSQGVNAWLGRGKWIVAEADESDGSFLRMPSTIGVITNIDPEHLDYYGSRANMEDAFATFLSHIPFYGAGVGCIDHSTVRRLMGNVKDRRIVSYGFSDDAMVRAYDAYTENYMTHFRVQIRSQEELEDKRPGRHFALKIPTLGAHNVQNALASIGVADVLGIKEDVVQKAFVGFEGVKRRFTKIGEVNGIHFIDDYAHHPVEIRATISSAKLVAQKGIVVIFQPHRYSRMQALYEDFLQAFAGVNHTWIAPIYSAGEQPIADVHHAQIASDLSKTGVRATSFEGKEHLPDVLRSVLSSSDVDMVLFLGAGSISSWAYDAYENLEELV